MVSLERAIPRRGPVTPRGSLAARIVGNPTWRRYAGGDIPDRDLRWAGIRPGMTVYELGAGLGLYSLPLAEAVGPRGRVLAGEYWPEGAAILAERARGASNLLAHVADGRALPVREGSLDAFCCFYSLEEITQCVEIAGEIARYLKPGGLAVLFLWRPLALGGKASRIAAAVRASGMSKVAQWTTLQNIRLVYEKQ